jgi:hypothetical protein
VVTTLLSATPLLLLYNQEVIVFVLFDLINPSKSNNTNIIDDKKLKKSKK